MKDIKKLMITLALLCLTVTSAWAQNPDWLKDGDTWDATTKTLTVNSNPGNLVYHDNTVFEHVIISSGVTSIGQKAFYYCSNLTSITIPSSVTNIGSDTFFGCTSITDVYCYPNAADLTWDEDGDDFKNGGSTVCHVHADQLSAYQSDFTVVNVTFVGDLPASAASTVEVDWPKASKTGTFTMPGGNVELEPEYYPQATADGAVTAATGVAATTDTPLVTVDETMLTGVAKMMYYVSTSTTAPAYDAEGWTDVLPTAANYTEAGNLNVWYYPVGTDEGVGGATATYSDGDMNTTALTVTLAPAPTYAVTLKEGTEDADKWTGKVGAATDYQALPLNVVEGAAVSLKFDGTKRVKSVKAVKKASVPDGAINGKFSVNNTGKQVYFAKGNLQAVCTSADNNPSDPETFTWQFAENQWDCVGNNAANNSIDGNGSVSAAGTVDLFGWSTATTTYGIHNSTTASDYSGDFVDWGGTIGTGWRTLTKDEWNYLFMTRESGSKVNGMSPSPDNARYTHATINTDNGTDGIRGMILFPDGVTVNYSDATYWGGINQYSNWNGSTKCTTSQWNALAAKGFVFLPTGGVRNGTTISNSNNNGYYWSSYTASSTNGSAHYTRVVPATEPTTDYDSRKIGISVRLVYDVE